MATAAILPNESGNFGGEGIGAEEQRSKFLSMVRAAEHEADHNGAVSLESVLAEIDEMIAAGNP